MKSIDVLDQTVDRFPDRPATIAPDGTTRTYEEIDGRATAVAHALEEAIGDARVASLLDNGQPAIDLFLASQKRGVAFVPLNTRADVDSQAHAVETADAELLVFGDGYERTAREIVERTDLDRAVAVGGSDGAAGSTTVGSYDRLLEADASGAVDHRLDPPEVGISFTSGTTGRPKGVLIDGEMAYYASSELVMEFGLAPEDVAIAVTPFFHVVTPYTWIMPHFQAGACVVLQPSFEPSETLRLIETHGVDHLLAVPAQLRALLGAQEEGGFDLSSLARIRSGGAPIEPETVRAVQDRLCENFHNTYGCTEAMGNVFHSYPFEQRAYPGVSGRPGQHWTVRVVEPAKPSETPDPTATVDPGERGEVLARGPSVADGYLDRSADGLFVDGWLRPGDVAELDEAGNYEVVDRIDNMIVSGGENVYPQEVEREIRTHPDVEEVVVFGVPDETWGEAVKAVVIGDATESELDAFCTSSDALADYKRPRYYEFAEELPRSPTGDLRRGKVEQRFG